MTIREVHSRLDPEGIDTLHRLDDSKRFRELLGFVGLYLAGAGLVSLQEGWWVTALGLFLMGLFFNALAIFLHEGLHGILFRGKQMNRWGAFLMGLPMGISASGYRLTHCYHHFQLGGRHDYGTYRQHFRHPALVWLFLYLQLLAGTIIYALGIPFVSIRLARGRSRWTILAEYTAISLFITGMVLWLPLSGLLLYWLGPLLVMNLLTNIRGLASHALGDPADCLLASRSVRTNALVASLFLHENYHLEHHLFPRVPSYHLKRLHRLVWPQLPYAASSTSYLHFLLKFFQTSLACWCMAEPRQLR